jgi:hypothetical protein
MGKSKKNRNCAAGRSSSPVSLSNQDRTETEKKKEGLYKNQDNKQQRNLSTLISSPYPPNQLVGNITVIIKSAPAARSAT